MKTKIKKIPVIFKWETKAWEVPRVLSTRQSSAPEVLPSRGRKRLERTPRGSLRPGEAGTSLPPQPGALLASSHSPWGPGLSQKLGSMVGTRPTSWRSSHKLDAKPHREAGPRRAWPPRFKPWTCLSWQCDLGGHALLGHQDLCCNVRTTALPFLPVRTL